MYKNVSLLNQIHDCTGCSMCAAVCKYSAIRIKEDTSGFYGAIVDESKCVNCSMCTKVCYKFDSKFEINKNEWYDCYSAVNMDENELKTASSGGVSVELMRECLLRGYHVVGVSYDITTNRAVTKIAKEEYELDQFKGSKYFQSYCADVFKEIVNDKSEQKYAIFGTPCQIYAFSKFCKLNKTRDKYLLIDIFCHGCPSLKLWDKYLDYIKEKYGMSQLDKINFRSKTYGWHEYCFDFISSKQVLSSSKYNDPFYELFFGNDIMNKACYDCIARSTLEHTDIRIGDFWGPRHDMDIRGVSAVAVSSEIGRNIFEAVFNKFYIENADFAEIISAQSYKKIHNYNSNRRNKLLDMLNTDNTLNDIVKKYRRMIPLKANLKRNIKSALKHLPMSIYLKVKVKLKT